MQGIRERRKRMRRIRIIIISVAAVIAVLAAAYFGMAQYFKSHFLFRTQINGLDVGTLTETEAEAEISQEEGDYLLIISTRDKDIYTVEGHQIDSNYVPDGSVGAALREQNAYNWITALFTGNHIDVATPMEYDSAKLQETVAALGCFEEENIIEPENARIERGEENYEVVPEVAGNRLILDNVIAVVGEAVTKGDGELHLTDEVYEKPAITTESSEITDTMAVIEKYLSTEVKYQIADYGETLERADVFDMMELSEDYTITLDETKLERFVQNLASKYNTYADVREFQTSAGDTVEIGGGDYGWVIDKEKEAELLKANIEAGGVTEREPEYNQRARVEGLDDIGDTYVEIDYTNQHLWYYEAGELKLDSDIVSGNIASGAGSPDGIFKIVYKQSPAVLVGEDYESDVDYFMVFAYNVGIHDASWRNGRFGGQYYKTMGSHGCVNVPEETASTLYGMLTKDIPVIAYYREEIKLTAENCRISNAYSYVDPEKETETETTGN